MRFYLVSETSVPEETGRLLRVACEARRIPFETVIGKAFDFDPARRLSPGDLLYNAATSVAASRTEQFLFVPGVATFHSDTCGIYFTANHQTLVAAASGIAVPRTVYLASAHASFLDEQVDRVGGFPVVLKVLGRSSGIGIMLAESMRSLRSLVDFTLAQGQNPVLCEFIPDAVHWRVVVLGGKAIAWYRNPTEAGDFRSRGGREPADFEAHPPRAAIDAAVRAVPLFRLEFAGVDVLEDTAGRVWFLEANFPCYFPHAQLYGGVDIAGQMVEFLASRSAGACA
ncbi:MAG: hypothetical protein KGN84_02230 [Acidobacteriota bacterium]|nr:hypothetical protein [Acidobacteriota bacterium]